MHAHARALVFPTRSSALVRRWKRKIRTVSYRARGGTGLDWEAEGRHDVGRVERRKQAGSFSRKGDTRRHEWKERTDRRVSSDKSDYPSQRDLRERIRGEAIYGISPVCSALVAGRRSLHTLFVQEGYGLKQKKDAAAFLNAIKSAQKIGCAVQNVSKHELNLLCNNRPHQGLILDASPLDFVDMQVPPEKPELGPYPVWVILDEVADPQNFGAILRSAHFLGAAGVITCSRNSAPLSPTVSKASAGALEWVDVHSVNNLPRFLERCQQDGWSVIGAAAEQSTLAASQLQLSGPTMLVFGNEGSGLRTNVRMRCTDIVRIDGSDFAKDGVEPSSVDSLNVSVAAGILLHALLHSSSK